MHHEQNHLPKNGNEIFKALSTAKCGMHKSIKLNYFEHINILESCNQPGIHNKSSNFIPEMVFCLEIKIQGFFFGKKNPRFDKVTL